MGHRAEKNRNRHGHRAVISDKKKMAVDVYRRDYQWKHSCGHKGACKARRG